MKVITILISIIFLGCQTKSANDQKVQTDISFTADKLDKIHLGKKVYNETCGNCHLKTNNTFNEPSLLRMQTLLKSKKDLIESVKDDSVHRNYYHFLSSSDIDNLKLFIEWYPEVWP